MSEIYELTAKLCEQQKALLSIIAEAESKVELFKKALDEGRDQLKKVESILSAMGSETIDTLS